MARIKFLFLFLSSSYVSLTTFPVSAQSVIVNSQSTDLSARGEGWSGQLSVLASLAAGNVQILRTGASVKAQHQTLRPTHAETESPWLYQRWLAIGSVSRGRAGGKKVENQGLVHLRWTRMWTKRWGHELFVQIRYNEFLRLAQRSLLGVGGRFDFLNHEGWLGWLGSAYMLEYNQLLSPDLGQEKKGTLEHRWSNYLVLRKSSAENRLLSQLTVFVQPRIDQLSDLRVFGTLDLVAKVGRRVGLGINAAMAFDADPPVNVRKTDLRLSSTLSVQIGG